jgi:proline iminopeptidase
VLLLRDRQWGNRAGCPVLFVHGGPGNSVADYDAMVGGGWGSANARFFPPHEFFVVEVDQRGTGKSLPSVRDDVSHMALYKDITIAEMSADFEAVREHLGLETWLVFGGSWGSTLGLDYAERYPERCLGLIIRGIFLDTEAEFNAMCVGLTLFHSYCPLLLCTRSLGTVTFGNVWQAARVCILICPH